MHTADDGLYQISNYTARPAEALLGRTVHLVAFSPLLQDESLGFFPLAFSEAGVLKSAAVLSFVAGGVGYRWGSDQFRS